MNIYQTPILLKGYTRHNPDGIYKVAKEPIPSSTGFTKPDYIPPSADKVAEHITAGGWVGHLVPEGLHILDVEDPIKTNMMRELCRQKGITPPPINHPNNGLQFIFSTGGGTLARCRWPDNKDGFPRYRQSCR